MLDIDTAAHEIGAGRRGPGASFDGVTTDQLPAVGAPVTLDGRTVGFVGTAVRHFELGPVALAVVKRNVPDDAALLVGDSAAAIDPS